MDADSIYEVPLILEEKNVGDLIVNRLEMDSTPSDLKGWSQIVQQFKEVNKEVNIGLVGKYTQSKDAYLSVCEALKHGGIELGSKVNIKPIEAGNLEGDEVSCFLSEVDGIIIPGGFGQRGIEGKIQAVRYAREKEVPFLGICLGMQVAAIEFARNVLHFSSAHSTEFDPSTLYPVIDLLPSQKDTQKMGGTMRLGNYRCILESSISKSLYLREEVWERHRHRYELNNLFVDKLEKAGLRMAGYNPDYQVVEIIELKDHPFFVGVQFHPEFKSRPNRAHPLFRGFVEAAYNYRQKKGR